MRVGGLPDNVEPAVEVFFFATLIGVISLVGSLYGFWRFWRLRREKPRCATVVAVGFEPLDGFSQTHASKGGRSVLTPRLIFLEISSENGLKRLSMPKSAFRAAPQVGQSVDIWLLDEDTAVDATFAKRDLIIVSIFTISCFIVAALALIWRAQGWTL